MMISTSHNHITHLAVTQPLAYETFLVHGSSCPARMLCKRCNLVEYTAGMVQKTGGSAAFECGDNARMCVRAPPTVGPELLRLQFQSVKEVTE